MQTEESLAHQAEVLIAALCPTADDPALCEAVLTVHWAGVGLAVYPVFFEANAICGALGACAKQRDIMREWTCEECTAGIGSIADLLGEQIPDIIEFLKVRLLDTIKDQNNFKK